MSKQTVSKRSIAMTLFLCAGLVLSHISMPLSLLCYLVVLVLCVLLVREALSHRRRPR